MPPLAPRRLLAAALFALVAALTAGATEGRSPSLAAPASLDSARAITEPAGTRVHRSLLAATTWRGGPIVTSTGETVTVFVSDSLPTVTPEQWADFLVRLDHGPEISRVTVRLGTLDDVQQICGARALGCYGDNQLISIGETQIDGTTADEVVRHEYGHHIAFNRSNPPWDAIDWGPKYWASAIGVCGRVKAGSAFPGDESVHYDQNPGEAWAETYRILEERKAGILTGSWQIVSQSFFPNDASLAAAGRDVLEPWTAASSTTYRTRFTKKGRKVWLVRVQTPLDGNLNVKAGLPKGGRFDVALLASNHRTVLKSTLASGTSARLVAPVCGQRSVYVRVTDRSGTGRASVTVSIP